MRKLAKIKQFSLAIPISLLNVKSTQISRP